MTDGINVNALHELKEVQVKHISAFTMVRMVSVLYYPAELVLGLEEDHYKKV